MNHCYKYAIAQFPADAIRNERLNLAIVVFESDRIEVRIPKSLDKLRAISSAINLDTVRDGLSELIALDDFARVSYGTDISKRMIFIEQTAPISFSALGEFYAHDRSSFDNIITSLLTKLVEPEKSPVRIGRRPTRLLREVKSAFKIERVLAKKDEGLDAHRIVSNHKVAEGLAADLILKNGAMHVVQTADASLDDGSIRRSIANIAVSALIFEQARMSFGDKNTRAKLVYKASSGMEALISPSLDAAEHQGASLINWESWDDRNKFIIELSSLAEPIPKKKVSSANIHASNQSSLKLN